MNKIISGAILLFVVACFISCQKDNSSPLPLIFFKKGSNYISKDDTIVRGAVLTVGIIGTRVSSAPILTKLTEVVTYDNTFDSTLSTTLITSNTTTDSFSHDYTINTRSIPGTERYTFTIYDKSGATNTLKINIKTE